MHVSVQSAGNALLKDDFSSPDLRSTATLSLWFLLHSTS